MDIVTEVTRRLESDDYGNWREVFGPKLRDVVQRIHDEIVDIKDVDLDDKLTEFEQYEEFDETTKIQIHENCCTHDFYDLECPADEQKPVEAVLRP